MDKYNNLTKEDIKILKKTVVSSNAIVGGSAEVYGNAKLIGATLISKGNVSSGIINERMERRILD